MSSESMQRNKMSAMYTQEQEQHFERLKLLFLWVTFFFIIGSYTVIRELRDSIFLFVVGKAYLNDAKIVSLIGFVPAIFLYSKLVDKMRRYYLLCAYCIVFALSGFIFAYFLGDPAIGIPNIVRSPDRIIGWAFYFFVEGFSPFVVSVFWAFLNSISSPEAAKNYGFLVSGSKVGGVLASASAWYFLYYPRYSDTANHQILILISSALLLCVPVIIYWMMKKVPGKFLHGYEAVYQVEKEKVKQGESETGIFAGLSMLVRYPYVLGIFCMVYFYEMVTTVLSIMRVGIAEEASSSMSGTSAYLYEVIFYTHAAGLVISLIGTGTLVRLLGEKRSLMLIPITSGLFLAYFMMSFVDFCAWCTSTKALIVGYIGLKAINYAFSQPVRESLYIPTVKEIKFKSKSWIDAFGSKVGKTSGAGFGKFAARMGDGAFFPIHAGFFGLITFVWIIIAYLLGKRFEEAVSKNEVIGVEEENSEAGPATVE